MGSKGFKTQVLDPVSRVDVPMPSHVNTMALSPPTEGFSESVIETANLSKAHGFSPTATYSKAKEMADKIEANGGLDSTLKKEDLIYVEGDNNFNKTYF